MKPVLYALLSLGLLALTAAPASAHKFKSRVSRSHDDGNTHAFTQSHSGRDVVTWMNVLLAMNDDEWDRSGERFRACTGDDESASGQGTWGDRPRGNLHSHRGDFRDVKPIVKFKHHNGDPVRHDPGAAVPEPNAALAFSVGSLLIAAATRRRR